LHLNSIAVGQLVAEAARRLGLPSPAAPTDYAAATVAGIAQALEELRQTGSQPTSRVERYPAGVDTWLRAFGVELREVPWPRPRPASGPGVWRLLAPPGYRLADALSQALPSGAGGGVVVCLPPEPSEADLGLLLDGARAVQNGQPPQCFVLVQ